jgi:hypothetical protein
MLRVGNFLHAHELPEDSGHMLEIQFFGPAKQDGEEIWTAENNPIGHTIITIGDEKFIYDALNKGLRAFVKDQYGKIHLTKAFNTPYSDVPSSQDSALKPPSSESRGLGYNL